ncbi:unnamed protein product [Umbelopsis sp. WA50703]
MSIAAMKEQNADEVVLETEYTNAGALSLYQHLGFIRDKRLYRYYLNGVDAFRLKLFCRTMIKCDGRKPGCVHCQDSDTQCLYGQSRKRGPRKGYVQQLEEKVSQLKELLEDADIQLPSSPHDRMGSISKSERRSTSPEGQNDDNVIELSLLKRPRATTDSLNNFPPKDLTLRLVDLFFQNANASFPLIHKGMFKASIERGDVFNGLLWAVLAIAVRFSNDSRMMTSPPHLAGEEFASKALACIDSNTFEPTLYNLQFWGIISAFEYGRASGARAWMYGGMAIRICLELGLNKEETLRTPMRDPEGKIDTLAMALRRRIFWSCFSIDKFASAGTDRPQTFDRADCDSQHPSIAESLILLEGPTSWDVAASKDTLVEVPAVHLGAVSIFGEVNKYMNRASSIGGHPVTWPPIAEFKELDRLVRNWRNELPERFHFNSATFAEHRANSNTHYMYLWLSAHILWATSALVLHRASLAFIGTDLTSLRGDRDTIAYEIQQSALLCKEAVDIAMDVFAVIREACGSNIMPFLCYTAYIVATVLMTSTFADESATSQKSNQRLAIIYKLMEHLEPYWPMCARVAATTKQLHRAHSRMYTVEPQTPLEFDNRKYDQGSAQQFSPYVAQPKSSPSEGHKRSPVERESHKRSPVEHENHKRSTIELENPQKVSSHQQANIEASYTYPIELQPAMVPALKQDTSADASQTEHNLPMDPPAPIPLNSWVDGDTDYNSLDFLFDGTLFGQMMFDAQKLPPPGSAVPSDQTGLDMYLFNGPGMASSDGFINKPIWDTDP